MATRGVLLMCFDTLEEWGHGQRSAVIDADPGAIRVKCQSLLAQGGVSVSSVVENNISYTCQEGTNTLEVPFGAVDYQCDQSWTTGKKPIAYYEKGKSECRLACKDVFSGKVILSECPNVTLTIGCTNKDGIYEETRLHFSAINKPAVSMTTTITSNQLSHYGFLAFLTLMVTVIIQFLL